MSPKEQSKDSRDKSRNEIAIVGELDDCESEVIGRLLELDDGAECTLYIDSGGGRVYSAMAIMSLMLLKGLRGRAVVLGACSSAALLILAGCRTRLAMPYSVFQFHPVRWESGENVEQVEASEWARHFGWLEDRCDELLARLFGTELAQIRQWSRSSRYLSGQDLADAGLVQILDPTIASRAKSRSPK